MPKPIIYFRADGNSQIGLGHIVRSLALADMLCDNFDCIFLVQTPSEALQNQITEKHQLIAFENTDDYINEAKNIAEKLLHNAHITVLDGYNFKTEYQKIIRSSGCKLVCIDDLHAWHFVADVVINHAGGIHPSKYSCEPYTKLCLGTEYALLRQPFLKAAQQLRKREDLSKVFICFGGADTHNLTEKTIKACLEVDRLTEIHVVTGSAYTEQKALKKIVSTNKKLYFYQNLSAREMAALMAQCDLAVAPASSISYELCCVGIGLVLGTYAANQQGIFNFLIENQLAIPLGGFLEITQAGLTCLIENMLPEVVLKQIAGQKHYFQTPRLPKVFEKLLLAQNVETAKASIDDMELYFDWANDKETRKNAINSEPIIFEQHKQWFQTKLSDTNTFLYKFTYQDVSLGQVRFELIDKHLEIGYSVAPQFRGKGFGEIIMQMALKALVGHYDENISNLPDKIIALVKPDNQASTKVFEHLNFEFTGMQTIKGVNLNQYQKPIYRVYK
ncbi:UDP-2,4-diacetamido-2,4,6-trideoxy-beta-L-altropyranose hydrolase [Microscilla marina]|uniref:Acetyltransferase, gnat family n=1 Tax=Microscilla marina ATCC 23134 TaxID=313606 RepID=A1ZCJ8_MICM2|nr:UDP-2,4-diacetamido-2,4,6-trideoxy-beta-L-altropyranose hydrolase [Microscilla marina]EAY32000.1 acetyltransferase, gnat family [Microscilla marina ATCC 23134]